MQLLLLKVLGASQVLDARAKGPVSVPVAINVKRLKVSKEPQPLSWSDLVPAAPSVKPTRLQMFELRAMWSDLTAPVLEERARDNLATLIGAVPHA